MNNRLYVGNLSYGVTDDALRSCFAECGEVTDMRIMLDRETGQPRGFAFVTMKSEGDATNAIKKLDGALLDGRALRVNVAEERGRAGGGGGGDFANRGGGGGNGGNGGNGGGTGGGGGSGGSENESFESNRNSRGGHRGW